MTVNLHPSKMIHIQDEYFQYHINNRYVGFWHARRIFCASFFPFSLSLVPFFSFHSVQL